MGRPWDVQARAPPEWASAGGTGAAGLGGVDWRQYVEAAGVVGDLAGVAVILVGVALSFVAFGQRWLRDRLFPDAYRVLRQSLGRSILLGLEILVAADIIRTVAVEPTLDSVAVLAGIVAIRTFLSFSLEVELEGRWPWQRAEKRG